MQPMIGQKNFSVKKFLDGISTSSGVYVMRGDKQSPLYIGKAKNLRNRLRSYFRLSSHSHRIQVVMQQVESIETIVTKSETEALLLENNLIKSNSPIYNINLKDDKSYPYIRLDNSHEYPKLSFYRGSRKESGIYFGPFSSAAAVRETLSQLQKVFPVRQCRDTFYRHRSRPCLQYQINRCTAPCVGLIDRESYLEDVRQVVRFLNGKSQELTNMLMTRMDDAAEQLDFELAAQYRDRISAVQRLRESQTVEGGSTDFDVIAIVESSGMLCIQMMIFRSGRNVDYRTFFPKLNVTVDLIDAISEFIPRYYLDREIPASIVIDREIKEIGLIAEALNQNRQRRVKIHCPQRGQKMRLIELATRNAQNAVRTKLNEKGAMQERMTALTKNLNLDESPNRIECFDISHTAGEKTVASCVVFDENGPLKIEYRTFNISDVKVADDYAAMQQALTRRYSKLREGNGILPDLVLLDGGKGQLNAALEVMDELQLADIHLVAISKGVDRKAGDEQIWQPGIQLPIEVDLPALLLLQQIRDEAHRFALLGHRGRRNKARKRSVLESIPGIGQKRRSALLRYFGGLQGISRANTEELEKVNGISPNLAEKIYYEFHARD